MGNWIDIMYIIGSIVMTFMHGAYGPDTTICKFLMCFVGALAFRRTMNFLRVINSLTPIVTMLTNVIWELRFFMTFYFIESLLFSLMLGVLGIGNWKIEGGFRKAWFTQPSEDICVDSTLVNRITDPTFVLNSDAPNYEYYRIGLFLGNLFSVIRMSMGDFAIIGAAEFIDDD